MKPSEENDFSISFDDHLLLKNEPRRYYAWLIRPKPQYVSIPGCDAMTADSQSKIRLVKLVHWTIWALVAYFVISTIFVNAYEMGSRYGIVPVQQGVYIVDFPSHFNFAKEFWRHRFSGHTDNSVYSIAYQLQVTRNWAGSGSFAYALPFGYSPTMLFILLPLIPLTHVAAFCLFNLFGLISIWWQTHPARCRHGIGLMAFLSPLAFNCMKLGQTALVTGAGVLVIFERTRMHLQNATFRSALLPGAVLWALTAKPPLALTVGALLVGIRCWRPILVATVLTICLTLAISPFLGPNWAADYMHMIGSYNRVQADPAIAWSLFPRHMANLRGVLGVDFGVPDDYASTISSGFWVTAMVILAAVGCRRRLRVGEFWSIGILLYLLFCPHVSSTEELQTALLIPFCISSDKARLTTRELLLLFSVPLLVFASPAVGPFFPDHRLPLFVAKILLILLLVFKKGEERQGA